MGLFSWLFGKAKAPQAEHKPVVCDSGSGGSTYTPTPAPPQTATIEDIARDSAAKVVMQNSIASTSLDQTTLNNVKQAAAHSAAKGENPAHNKVTSLLPGDFEWKEYDEWLARFKKESVWPWEAAGDLWEFNEEAELCSLDELLSRLSKAELLDIAGKRGIPVHKSKAKAAIAAELAAGADQSSDTQVKAIAIELISAKLKAAAIREKKELFASWVQTSCYEKSKVERWSEKYVKLSVAPDACPICKAMKKKKWPANDLPKLHPGCRCTFMPTS